MPATYTYNDGIEDAKREIVRAWEQAGEPFQTHMEMVLGLMSRLDSLKRRPRRKRAPKIKASSGSPLDKILDEDRIKGPARHLGLGQTPS